MQDYKQLIKNAAGGSSEAHYRLGEIYRKGKIIKADALLSFKWYSLSALQNHPDGCLGLAWCYFLGNGTKKNKQLAIEYFLKSAYFGNTQAQTKVASLYSSGVPGVLAKDRNRAYAWYDMAVKSGTPSAEAVSGKLHTEIAIKNFGNEHELDNAKNALQKLISDKTACKSACLDLQLIIKEAIGLLKQSKLLNS